MNESFVIDLGDAKEETKGPQPIGCVLDGTTEEDGFTVAGGLPPCT